MTAPTGTEVGLYVDLLSPVAPGHVIETGTGRRYGVVSVRVQARGKHTGRQHLRALVLEKDAELGAATRVHTIRWYSREKGRR